MSMFTRKFARGYTLIELSIVLVIVGAIIAVITAGSGLMKQAELRSVISELQQYHAAYNTFVVKYDRLPGDMDNATQYWPKDGQCVATVAGNEGVCNGNGDGIIGASGGSAIDDEICKAIKHLSLSGIISGSYPVCPTSVAALVVGGSAPGSKVPDAGYFWGSGGVGSGSAFPVVTNVLFLGRAIDASVTKPLPLLNSALTPEEAFNIDQKMDDGRQLASMDSLPKGIFDSIISSAIAIRSGGGLGEGGGAVSVYMGAHTGSIRVEMGFEAIDSCTADMATRDVGYNLAVTKDACILLFALN